MTTSKDVPLLHQMSMDSTERTGPLSGIKVVEIAGIGPAPHACMLLADLGADVIRIERPGGQYLAGGQEMVLNRGRPSVVLDLKHSDAVGVVLDLVRGADVLIEGMRPGVAERLGIGPEQCHQVNAGLVYGRMTGWGQDGPLARSAGHDLNYIAISGALFGFGQDKSRPHFPANVAGDFGGGSMYLVVGVLSALLERVHSGLGQVVDAAIVDGAAHLNAMSSAFLAAGDLVEERAANLLDGGSPFYDLYETSDGRHMSVGALEPGFFDHLVRLLGIADRCPGQHELDRHGEMRALLTDTFRSRTQAEWVSLFEGQDACVAGVIPLSEAHKHPHLEARGTHVESHGVMQPAPAPRFSRTPGQLTTPPSLPGQQTRDALRAWGIANVDDLVGRGIARQAD